MAESISATPSAAAGHNWGRALAWGTWLTTTVILGIGFGFLLARGSSPTPVLQWGFPGWEAILATPFATVGAIIIARHPENRIGLTLALMAPFIALQLVFDSYAELALVPGQHLAGAQTIAWP